MVFSIASWPGFGFSLPCLSARHAGLSVALRKYRSSKKALKKTELKHSLNALNVSAEADGKLFLLV